MHLQQEETEENMNTASVDVQINKIRLFVIHIFLYNRDSVFGRDRHFVLLGQARLW
jgi:hypothetical protein